MIELLVAQYQIHHDIASRDKIFSFFWPKILRYIKHISFKYDHCLPCDLQADAYIALDYAINTYNPSHGKSFRNWMYTQLKFHLLKYFENRNGGWSKQRHAMSQGRKTYSLDYMIREDEEHDLDKNLTYKQVPNLDFIETFENLVKNKNLSTIERQVLRYTFVDGYNLSEIGQIMHRTAKNIGNHKSLAIAILLSEHQSPASVPPYCKAKIRERKKQIIYRDDMVKVILFCREWKTTSQMRERIGYSATYSGCFRKLLKELISKNIIETKKEGRITCYRLIKKCSTH